MKKRMYRARRRMNHVISELSHVLLMAGGQEISLRLTREENGLRLHLEGDFHNRGKRAVFVQIESISALPPLRR